MRNHRLGRWCIHGAALWLAAAPLAAQTGGAPRSAQLPVHARVLAALGRSGLRGLLSASGALGDLQDRAGSYRMAVQSERARVAALEGRIAALDEALADPALPVEERTAVMRRRQEASAELTELPRYDASYRSGSLQVEALRPLGSMGSRRLFLLARGRAHARWGGRDGLTVFSEAVAVGPVVVVEDRWVLSAGIGAGRTDVDIGLFDGSSGSTFLGPRLDAGRILGEGWSVAVQLAQVWSHANSTIHRPDSGGLIEVRSEGWSRVTSGQAEVKGRFSLTNGGAVSISMHPRFGAFLLASYTPAITNSLGEMSSGPFGERDGIAAVRVGASLEASHGPFSPTIYAAWEGELTDEMSVLVDDPHAFLAMSELTWSWARGRRMSLQYTVVRGLHGLRRVSELTLVVIVDG